MATLREWLNEISCDWDNGVILYQETKDENDMAGWSMPVSCAYIEKDNSVLDQEFCDGFGSPNCPRIIAKDKNAIYFPAQYDGLTWLEKVVLNLDYYLDVNHESPYPGK